MKIPPKEIPAKLNVFLLMLLVVSIFVEVNVVVKNVRIDYPDYHPENIKAIVQGLLILLGDTWIIMGRIKGTYVLGATFLGGILCHSLTANHPDALSIWRNFVLFSAETLGPLLMLLCKKDGVSGWRVLLENHLS